MKSQTPLLETKNLSKSFGGKHVLENINLQIYPGQIIGLLGQNGAGKSTLIKLLNDLLTPTSGSIAFCGHALDVNSKLRTAYLPERTYLDRTLTVHESVALFSSFYSNFDCDKAEKLLESFDLDSSARISTLSKGMQEKLQLALVMSRRADLYILDEPLGGIDPATRDYILDTIITNFDDGASMLISTHLIADVERILDRVIFLHHGQIVEDSLADTLRAKYETSIDEIFRDRFMPHRTTKNN